MAGYGYNFSKEDYIKTIMRDKAKITRLQHQVDQLNYDCELYKDYIRMMEDKKNIIVGKV